MGAKALFKFLFVTGMALALAACAGEAGPEGPAGPQNIGFYGKV